MSVRRVSPLLALLAGCVTNVEVDRSVAAVAIPGPWVAPASTRAVAATQHVSVVDPPAVSPLGRCTSTNPFACSCTHPACMAAYPGTRDLNAFLLRRFPFLRAGGTYCCRQNSSATSVPMLSVHAIGRAMDLMVPMVGGDADNTLGDAVANWLVENASFIGVQRVIWDRAYWNGERGFGLLTSASLPHTDHLHVELGLAGAGRQTPFFTTGAVNGTSCSARCDGARLVRDDCTVVDCAASSAPCVAGSPPRCGDPAPAEPAEARAVPGAAVPAANVLAGSVRLTFVPPVRLFDTRTAEGAAPLGRTGPIAPGAPAALRDFSRFGLPTGAVGAWLNVAAVGTGAPGFVTVYPAGDMRPPTSTVNFTGDVPRANSAPVTFGLGGVAFEASAAPAHVIADLYATLSPTGAGLTPVAPFRALDTRSDVALVAGEARAVDVRAPAGAAGVSATVAILAGDAAGFVVAYPCGAALPVTSHINFGANAVVANAVASPLGGGSLCLRSNVAAHAVVDVTGYFVPTGGLSYTAITPQRLLDTREATSLYTGRLGDRQVIELPIQRMAGLPTGVGAVVANLTAVGATSPGFATAFPCGGPVPNTSSLNYPAADAAGAVTVSALGGGSLCVFANTRTHLIVDVLGVWSGAAMPLPPAPPTDDGDDIPPEGDAGAPDAIVAADAVVGDAGTAGDGSAVGDGSAPEDGSADAGSANDGPADGSAPDDGSREVFEGTPGSGCACRARPTESSRSPIWLAALALLARRRRRR
ncbi:MAG: hypothetical protein U0324_03650 [Polyangiales bacterium]